MSHSKDAFAEEGRYSFTLYQTYIGDRKEVMYNNKGSSENMWQGAVRKDGM